MLIEEKLENIHAKFETSPSKDCVTTTLGDECFEKFCTKGHKLLKLQPCKTTVVHALKDKCIKQIPHSRKSKKQHLPQHLNNVWVRTRELTTCSPGIPSAFSLHLL